jgi:hypothetical protein
LTNTWPPRWTGPQFKQPISKKVVRGIKRQATVTKEQAAEADKFNDRVTELKASFEKVVRTLAMVRDYHFAQEVVPMVKVLVMVQALLQVTRS